jgi:hypothetical protein
MQKSEVRVGQKVYFGRPNGERTLGEIVKINPKKAKVRTLEARGRGRGSGVGTEWAVPYSMLTPADATAPSAPSAPTAEPTELQIREPFDRDIMRSILGIYAALSPEWLTCDGEASAAHVRARSRALNAKLEHLFRALGRRVSEIEAYEWLDNNPK